MNRPTDQKPVRGQPANGIRRHGIGAQVHAIDTAGDGDIDPVVDNDAGCRPARNPRDGASQRRERRRLEVPFANLNQVDACLDRMMRLRNRIRAAAVRHEADDHGRPARSDSDRSVRSREINTRARSANPANKLTKPSPVTAPRTKLFVTTVPTSGHVAAK